MGPKLLRIKELSGNESKIMEKVAVRGMFVGDNVYILHLSDIHFGVVKTKEITDDAVAGRALYFESLLEKIREVSSNNKIDVVVVSGDIGWQGKSKDYVEAEKWFSRLEIDLHIDSSDFVFCPGNHDIDRDKTKGMNYPHSAQEADELLSVDNVQLNYLRLFEEYNNFCARMRIPKFDLGDKKFYPVGQRVHKAIRFVVLNSSWFSRSDEDRGNLWIGKPHIRVMRSCRQLSEIEDLNIEPITITVFHHPPHFLNLDEYTLGTRSGGYDEIVDRSNFILSGHTHGRPDRPDWVRGHAWHFSGGVTYEKDCYKNSFSVLQVNLKERWVARTSFEYDSGRDEWRERKDEKTFSLEREAGTGASKRFNDNRQRKRESAGESNSESRIIRSTSNPIASADHFNAGSDIKFEPMNYNLGQIRKLIKDSLSSNELDELIFDNFYELSTAYAGKLLSNRIMDLVDWCHRHGKMKGLLDQVQRINPYMFERYATSIQKDAKDKKNE